MTRVSVVIPTYNRADLVGRTIDSALEQTLSDIEIIVVDDGSDDDTSAVVESYDEPNVELYQHETNRGGSAARNTGIEAAKGDYIAFLDSDDEWRPEKIERQIETLERRSDEYVAAYCDIVERRTGLQKLLYAAVSTVIPSFEKSSTVEGGAEIIQAIHTNRFHLGGASTLIVKHDTVEKVAGFDERFPRHQDLEFLVRVLRHGHLAYVPEELVVRHDTGMPDVDVYEEAKQLYFSTFEEDIQELRDTGIPVNAYHRFSLSRYYFQQGDVRSGTKYLVRSRAPKRSQYLRLLWSLTLGLRKRVSPARVGT